MNPRPPVTRTRTGTAWHPAVHGLRPELPVHRGRVAPPARSTARWQPEVEPRLTEVLVLAVDGRLSVSVQNPVVLDDRSQPEPDLAVLRRRDDGYTTGLPGVADVVLLVEVADSSASEDRRAKIPRYAAAGVPEVWLLDLAVEVLERHREPTAGGLRARGPVDGRAPRTRAREVGRGRRRPGDRTRLSSGPSAPWRPGPPRTSVARRPAPRPGSDQ